MFFIVGLVAVLAFVGYVLALKLTLLAQVVLFVLGMWWFVRSTKEDAQQGVVGYLSIGASSIIFVLPVLVGALIGNIAYYITHHETLNLPTAMEAITWLVRP